jgi:putative YhbY family RNA-binding protein
MKTLTPSQRRALRAKAHALHPFVAIGQHGLTPAVLHEIDVALLAHELIKIRVFSDARDDREGMLARICTELDAAPVQHIGKLLVVWRQAPAPEPTPVATRPARTRARAPRTPAKTAGKKPKGNTRTMVTTGAKRTPRAGTAMPASARRRGAARGTTAASFAEEPGTRRRSRDAEPDARRGAARAKPKPGAPRGGATAADRKPTSKRPPSPHGKSASSIGGASGARRRRKAR